MTGRGTEYGWESTMGMNSPMQAMGAVMKHFGKLADGSRVKQILKDMGNK